ncbi:hypothetical protein N9S00_00095 [Luminiphilus sp.]|nr:hypothetical protein [Luminiphilus sp.]
MSVRTMVAGNPNIIQALWARAIQQIHTPTASRHVRPLAYSRLYKTLWFFSLTLLNASNVKGQNICDLGQSGYSFANITLTIDQGSATATSNGIYYQTVETLTGEIPVADTLCTSSNEFTCTINTSICFTDPLTAGGGHTQSF